MSSLDVQSTAHGPLLNPLLAASDPPIALKWTLYDPSLNTLPLYEMNTASNWTEFSAALAAVVLAHAESRLRRRSGPHRLPRHRHGSAAARQDLPTCPSTDNSARVAGLHSLRRRCPTPSIRPRAFLPPPTPASPPTSRPTRSPTSGSIPTASSASTNRSTAATISRPPTCWPSRPTSTAKSIRRWAIALPTPSTTLPAPKAMATRGCARPPT